MSTPARRGWLLGRAIVAILLALVALPAYLTVSLAWRPAAVRLACAVALAIGCVHARRWARSVVTPDARSPFDAPPPPAPAVQLDPAFIRLRADLVASTRSRRYFDVVLWPRLTGLAGSPLVPPAARRVLTRRGPPLRTIAGLVADVEQRS